MKLTIEPTEHFFMAGDVMVRMWQGRDDRNQEVVALVSAVIFTGEAADAVAELNLVSIPPPTPEDAKRWAETVLTTRTCRVCGCTDLDCSSCIARTGSPCFWVEADLCSACAPMAGRT